MTDPTEAWVREADSDVERLSPAHLRAVADPDDIVAGFRVPEQSVETQWLCDRLRLRAKLREMCQASAYSFLLRYVQCRSKICT